MLISYMRLPRFEYALPRSFAEALDLLSRDLGKAKVFAGGTDLLPKLKRREIAAPQILVDLKGIADLRYIHYDDRNGLRFGPLTTISDIEESPIIRGKFGVLAQAARTMASRQIRNRGTIAGNICNAVPSMDSAPALLTLEARAICVSHRGERNIRMEDFFTGPNETILSAGEILREIRIPPLPASSKGIYLKLSPRKAMDLAIAGVAVVAISEKGVCKDIRVALGAVAPTPKRVKTAEDILRGEKYCAERIEKMAQVACAETQPIDDHRASAEYRRNVVKVLVRRAVQEIAGEKQSTWE